MPRLGIRAHVNEPGRGGTRLVRAAMGTTGLTAYSRMIALATGVVMARIMGPSQYGVYATVLAWVTILGIPTTTGLPTLLVRLLPAYRVQGEWGLARGLLRKSYIAVALAGTLTGALGTLYLTVIYGANRGPVAISYLWGMALLPIMGALMVRSAAVRGFHHVIASQVPASLVLPSLFLALVGSWALLSSSSNPLPASSALFLRFGSAATALIVAEVLLRSRLPREATQVPPESDVKSWTRSAVPLVLLGGLTIVNNRTDIVMLGAILGSSAAGIYQAASRGAEIVALALVAVNLTIQPRISQLYALGEQRRLQRLLTSSARISAFCSLPLALGFSVYGRPILSTVFGAPFVDGSTALAILSAGQVTNAAMGSVSMILAMTGHERQAASGMALGAILNIALNALLIPTWGISGAAAASAVSLVAWNVVQAFQVRMSTGLHPSAFGRPPHGGTE